MTAENSLDGYCAGVAAGHAATAGAAAEVLRAGGNAFDAAIAAFLAACVAEPVLASLGGGGFLAARRANASGTNATEVFDFFTQTPRRRPTQGEIDFKPITADFGIAQQEFHIGLGAVATPGAVAGIFAVHDALGRMPMADIAAPAIALARDGVRINPFQAYLLGVVAPIYTATPGAVAQFCRPNVMSPTLLPSGAVYQPTGFAKFLSALVSEGAELFYQGAIADAITGLPGCAIGRDDLAGYRVQRRAPWTAHLDGTDVFLNPPPAAGGALIAFALAHLNAQGPTHDPAGALVDAMSAANQARSESGLDAAPEAGAEVLRQMMPNPPAYRGTTHISTADSDGNIAAITVSNGEGCGHVLAGTGIMLNNMLGEDDLNAAGFFTWPEDVRLSSMMAPGLMSQPDGTWTAFGSGGSNRIRSALTQVIVNIARHGMDVTDAVNAPRLHLEGTKLSLEPGFDDAMIAAIKATAVADDISVWPEQNMFFGGVHVLCRAPAGHVQGAGDPRRDGVFIGI
mgnify:FL=1|tara:strand:+ start:54 stop:1592 length:1539 start_codon:yes stop_codon:yes gene_type:complete